ncbi:hypothetical protein CEXT_670381 [Caerostris extrusa]|uniref:Uncharacterized protein n=1 Tax=Caerostris extrusa TaxID=172846 RepID=A0AAV4WGT1_CAEEX|nr:hypothetical protein CEXT_670381 [Caerostris extrusa]
MSHTVHHFGLFISSDQTWQPIPLFGISMDIATKEKKKKKERKEKRMGWVAIPRALVGPSPVKSLLEALLHFEELCMNLWTGMGEER